MDDGVGTRREHDVPGESTVMWHVTLTVAGEPLDPFSVRACLQRLTQEHPFLLSARYAADRAELRYWEEAGELEDAAALGLRLWGEHRTSAQLPPWRVVGLEVVDRTTFQRRSGAGSAVQALLPAGEVTPL